MKALVVLFLVACLFVAVRTFLPYSIDTLRLGVGYTAKEFCTCLYVMGRDEGFCRNFIRAVDKISFGAEADHVARRTTASLYGIERRAYFEGERTGCRLDLDY